MYLLTRKQLKELLRDEQIYKQFTFSEKEMEILQLLSKGYTLQEIGKLYGVTRQRIHQVYRNASKYPR